jgi:hypothetical protein
VLSTSDMARCQTVLLGAMDMTLAIDRPTNTTGVWGTTMESFTPIVSGVPCLLTDPTDQPINAVGQSEIVGVLQAWSVWVPNGTNVRENDRVTVAPSGQVMRVQAIDQPRTTYFMLDSFLATVVR